MDKPLVPNFPTGLLNLQAQQIYEKIVTCDNDMFLYVYKAEFDARKFKSPVFFKRTFMLHDLEAAEEAVPIWKVRSLQASDESTYTESEKQLVFVKE